MTLRPALSLLLGLAALTSPALGQSDSTARSDSTWTNERTGMTYRFHTGKRYGSDASFNPISEVLNEGFDVLGLQGQSRHIFDRGFAADFHNVWRSVFRADETYRDYGPTVVRNEFLPITSTRVPGGGSWLPNYEAHLMGSGMVSRKMTEWYDAHGYPHPAILGALTMYMAHFTNETVENNGFRRLNEDATTDLLFFDAAGIALWRNDAMQRAFSGTFRLVNWPLQPSWNPASGTLENTGQNFVLRGPIPHSSKWRWFYLFGLTGSGGITRVFDGGNALSIGAGLDAIANPVTDSLRGTRSATLRPKAAVYFDRNGSLLWSLTVGSPNGLRSWLSANVYPGVLRVGGFSPGLWVQLPRRDASQPHDGAFRVGIVSSFGLGISGGAVR